MLDLDWASIWQWLKDNETQMELCIGILGALVTLGGLIFAGLQIKSGANALQASTLYQIQKDGRQLRDEALKDTHFVEYVEKYDSHRSYTTEMISAAAMRVGIILQFYASIFNQWRFGTLNDATWQVAQMDLCGFVNREPVRSIWRNNLSQGGFSTQFVDAVNECLSA